MTAELADVRWFARPDRRRWNCPAATDEVAAFHAGLPGYAPTPLVEIPRLAAELGVGRLFVKDEGPRFGLGAFKILGVSWAVHRVLVSSPGAARLRLVCATKGNHGRAVARTARLLGHSARVHLPELGLDPLVEAAIAAEGADVRTVPGDYDAAVRVAAEADGVLVQDTAWPGYERIPEWIGQGYRTLFTELDDQLRAVGAGPPGLVVVPVGVGSLLRAALSHLRSRRPAAAVLAVEPEVAACALASVRRGRPVSVPTAATAMSGMNCGTLSSLAWPVVRDGLDAAVAVTDPEAARAVADLVDAGLAPGPCGAAALAGARLALTGSGSAGRRADLGVGSATVAVLLSTEGASGVNRSSPARV